VGLAAIYPAMLETLVTTSRRSDTETLARHVVLAHWCTTYHPHMRGPHRGAVALINYVGVRLLLGQTRGGGNRD
jgi:hypothetical protein